MYIRLAGERLRTGVAYRPLAPGFVADPYPLYRRLRERDPIHRSIFANQVVASRYADVDRIMKAVAVPLPTIVIARMIGVRERDHERFKVWSDDLARALEPFLSPEEEQRVYRADRQFAAYFTAIIEQRRRAPRDDLVSRLVEAEDAGDKLTAEETWVMLPASSSRPGTRPLRTSSGTESRPSRATPLSSPSSESGPN